MRRSIVGTIVAVGLLSACSASPAPSVTTAPPASTATADDSGSSAAGGDSAPPASTTAPASYAVTGTASDAAGDKATVSVSIGTPVPYSSLSQQQFTGCADTTDQADRPDPPHTVAIPIDVTATVTSSIPVTLIVGLSNVSTSDGSGGENLNYWWDSASSGPTCDTSGGAWTWDNLEPGQPGTWNGYLFVEGVITPDDPTGSAAKKTIMDEPQVSFANQEPQYKVNLAESHNIVNCDGPVLAVAPDTAMANGCTK